MSAAWRGRFQGTVDLLMATYQSWRADRTMRLGAGLAYYGLFAFVPLVTLIGALATVVFSRQEVQSYLAERFEGVFAGEAQDVAELVADQLASGDIQAGLGAIGGVSLLIAGSLVFVALQDALNVIWQVPVGRGLGYTIRRYALGFGVVLLIVAVLIASMAVQAIFTLVEAIAASDLAGLEAVARFLAAVASWVLGVGAIALLFRVLSGGRAGWRESVIGGAITAFVTMVGTWVIGWYLSRFGSTSLSGAAGGMALILVWIYYEAQILLAGAQLTKVMGERRAATHCPEDGARVSGPAGAARTGRPRGASGSGSSR